MSYEEKGTWVYLVVSAGVYLVYASLVLGRAADPLSDTPYQAVLLWSIAASVVASVVIRVVVEAIRPSESHRADRRDREIDRLSVVRTWWFLIAGAVAALGMALAEWPHFWIANVLYLGFVAQAVAGSVVKLLAYRRGF